LRLQVVANRSASQLVDFVQANIEPGSIVITE
jgi:hypothetical protein